MAVQTWILQQRSLYINIQRNSRVTLLRRPVLLSKPINTKTMYGQRPKLQVSLSEKSVWLQRRSPAQDYCLRPSSPMAKPHREGTAPNLESSSEGEAWHSDMAQKGQPELHIEADAADGHGEQEAPPSPHNVQALLQTSLRSWMATLLHMPSCLLQGLPFTVHVMQVAVARQGADHGWDFAWRSVQKGIRPGIVSFLSHVHAWHAWHTLTTAPGSVALCTCKWQRAFSCAMVMVAVSNATKMHALRA